MFVSCGDTSPHDHHDYQIDGDWYSCGGISSRDNTDPFRGQ